MQMDKEHYYIFLDCVIRKYIEIHQNKSISIP